MKIHLVGCAKTKSTAAGELPARERYTSALFRKALAAAEGEADRVYIVSASHGLIGPDDPLAWYDDTLRDKSKRARQAWGDRIVDSLIQRHGAEVDVVVIWAGAEYADPIRGALMGRKRTALRPLHGMQIGERLAYLTMIIAAHATAQGPRPAP